MTAAALASLLAVTLGTLIHYEALRWLSAALPALRMPSRARLLVAVFGALLAHAAEITLYAAGHYSLVHAWQAGTLGMRGGPSVQDALYFSAETFTSLGYGDLVPHGPLRALAGVETLHGLVLIGWTASFLYVAMERFWVLRPPTS